MARLNFPLQTYALESLPESAQDVVNLYAEPGPPGGRVPVILKSTPGLVSLLTLLPGPIRALDFTQPGRLYAVSGDQFIRYSAEGGAVSIGTVGATARPTIAVGPTAVVVCTPPDAYIADHFGTLHQIADFPGASSVAYINGYWVFSADETGTDQFFWSNLLDGDTYSGLDFASADARPNVIKRLLFHRGELWIFGDAGVEVWFTTGDANAPFARRAGSDIPFGCAVPATIAECDNSLIWLGTGGVVYRSEGYAAKRISTFAIEEWIRRYGVVEFASGLAYLQMGHYFYALSFERPDGTKRTWVYDAATNLWHRRASGPGGSGRWLADCASQFGGTAVFGDKATSTVYGLDPDTRTDNGQVLRRIACFPPVGGPKWNFMSRFEVEHDAGTLPHNPSLQLDWSDDGGRTYGAARSLSAGSLGDFAARSFTNRLGRFRHRVMRVQAEDIVTFYGAEADIEEGTF